MMKFIRNNRKVKPDVVYIVRHDKEQCYVRWCGEGEEELILPSGMKIESFVRMLEKSSWTRAGIFKDYNKQL